VDRPESHCVLAVVRLRPGRRDVSADTGDCPRGIATTSTAAGMDGPPSPRTATPARATVAAVQELEVDRGRDIWGACESTPPATDSTSPASVSGDRGVVVNHDLAGSACDLSRQVPRHRLSPGRRGM